MHALLYHSRSVGIAPAALNCTSLLYVALLQKYYVLQPCAARLAAPSAQTAPRWESWGRRRAPAAAMRHWTYIVNITVVDNTFIQAVREDRDLGAAALYHI